jgi:hypothetical protein
VLFRSHYFLVPNLECAEQIRKHIDLFLKGYDQRYQAHLEVAGDG